MRLVDAWNRGEGVLAQRHQSAVGNFRIAARGWQRTAAHPRVHVGNHGAPEIVHRKRRLRLLAQQVSLPSLWRERSGEMLQASEVVDADVVRNRRIALAVGAGVYHRAGAPPVFVRRVGEKNLWRSEE